MINEFFDWNFVFGEKGMELFTESFYYYSTGDSVYELKEGGGFSAYTPYGKTYWRQADTEVFAEITHDTVGGPKYENMVISCNGNKIRVQGRIGYGQKQGPLFTIKDGYIYTVYGDSKKYAPCKIAVNTGEITFI